VDPANPTFSISFFHTHLDVLKSQFDYVMREGEEFAKLHKIFMEIKEPGVI